MKPNVYEIVSLQIKQAILQEKEAKAQTLTLSWLARSLAMSFKQDNKKFDTDQFLLDCGINP